MKLRKGKVLVYRVETDAEEGPYTSSAWWRGWALTAHNGSQHPSPREDGINLQAGLLVCGFASLDKLLSWFEPLELINLQALGFQVSVYEVNRRGVETGKKQVAFCKDGAKFKAALPLAPLLRRGGLS